MARKIILPSSIRAKAEHARINENFPKARKNLTNLISVSMPLIGIDWNSAVLKRLAGSKVGFSMFDENQVGGPDNYAQGKVIHDIYDTPGLEIAVENNARVGKAGLTHDYIVRALEEAFEYTGKLKILEDTEFLPQGESEPQEYNGLGHGGNGNSEGDPDAYRKFAMDLLRASKSIIKGKVNDQFDKYIIGETNQGWYIAFNPNYGDAPYAALELGALKQSKRELAESKDAIKHIRLGNWQERLRALF